MKLIPKDALVAEIERRLHFDNNWIEGDKRRQMHTNGVSTAYYRRIGSKHACESILDFVNTLEVKEVDLDEYYHKFLEKEWFGNGCVRTVSEMMAFTAKHFFELGLVTSNPITAKDRGTAEEIITHLKRVENDYKIDLTREMKWLRSKIQKGE